MLNATVFIVVVWSVELNKTASRLLAVFFGCGF